MQRCDIDEGELAEILLGDEALLDHLGRARNDVSAIRHIKMM